MIYRNSRKFFPIVRGACRCAPPRLSSPVGCGQTRGAPAPRHPYSFGKNFRESFYSHKKNFSASAWVLALVGVAFFSTLWPGSAKAEEDPAKTLLMDVTTEDGLHFKLPPDWPIKRRSGVTAPVPIEEYLAQKFSVLDKRFESLNKRLQDLESRLKAIEAEREAEEGGLRSGEGSSP